MLIKCYPKFLITIFSLKYMARSRTRRFSNRVIQFMLKMTSVKRPWWYWTLVGAPRRLWPSTELRSIITIKSSTTKFKVLLVLALRLQGRRGEIKQKKDKGHFEICPAA